MAHRRFEDENGRVWEAWDVHPSTVERSLRDPHGQSFGESTRKRTVSFALPPEMRDGWLAFQSGDEARRLAPTPANWERLSDRELAALLSFARAIVRHRRRLPGEGREMSNPGELGTA